MTTAAFKGINYSLFIIVVILTAVGILMTYSSSAIFAMQRYNDPFFFLKRQMMWGAIGIAAMIIASRIDYREWERFFIPLFGLTILLLILVLMPGIGREVNGAKRWLRFGAVSFQPAELAKLTIIIYVARLIVKKEEKIKDFMNGFFPIMSVVGLTVMLIMIEPDVGTAMTIGMISVFLLFAGGARLRHITLLGLLLAPILYNFIFNAKYRLDRWTAYWDPWKDPLNSGYQIIQSFLAFGRGGISGAGLGEGKQKLFFLPEAHTDFIFSVVGEETGFVGSVSLIALFAIFIGMGFIIAMRTEDPFAKYLSLGITIMIGFQTMMNIAVVTGLLPTKGIPLPFISFGGSSLLINMIGAGILMSILRHEGGQRRLKKGSLSAGRQ